MNRQFKVIVADDERLIANNIARRIEENNGAFRVVSRVGTGREALEQVKEFLPDVVFSDIKMPEMDGIELITHLRREYPSVLCVMVSGYSDFDYMKAAIQNSAVDYLLKPVNPEELKRLLRRLENALLARDQRMVPRRESDAASLAEKVRVYLQQNYDQPVDLSALADSLAVSAPYLSKLFHEQTGTSPIRYLTEYRMQHARKLLMDTRLTVKEVAERVGYPDPFHFSRSFKNAVGVSPAQFREQQPEGTGGQKDAEIPADDG